MLYANGLRIFQRKYLFQTTKLEFHTSAALNKLIKKHKSKYHRKHFIPPHHKYPYLFDDVEDNLKQFDKLVIDRKTDRKKLVFPPAVNYFNIPDEFKKSAWKWYMFEKKINNAPNVETKTEIMSELEPNMWFHKIHLPLNKPDVLPFAQFITNTALIDAPEEEFSVSNHVLAQLVDQLAYVQQVNDIPDRTASQRIHDVMETVHRFACTLSTDLMNAQVDRRARVETFFKKNNYEDLEVEDFDETVRCNEGFVRYYLLSDLCWQIRSREQPQPFFSLDEAKMKATHDDVPLYNYHPKVVGISEPFDYWSFASYNKRKHHHANCEYARSLAGAWTRDYMQEGTPCQFGRLGVLDVTAGLNNDLVYTLKKFRGLEKRHWLAQGIMTGFSWATAQAFNQGLTYYNHLPAPFAAPLLLTDGGVRWQFLPVQLNSLRGLWWPQGSQEPVNLAVQLHEPRELFHGNDVNPEVASMLLQCVMRPVLPVEHSKELRCYLPDEGPGAEPALTEKKKFINVIDEEPESEYRVPEHSSEYRSLRGQRRALPNEIYLHRPVDDRDLLEDLRHHLPHLPGLNSYLPEEYRKKANFRMRLKRFHAGRYKTLRVPSKYK